MGSGEPAGRFARFDGSSAFLFTKQQLIWSCSCPAWLCFRESERERVGWGMLPAARGHL